MATESTEGRSNVKSFAYHEPADALSNRIQSHAKYSNFNLHQWIDENFAFAQGDAILDIGCGNGNYTELFWKRIGPTGTILGVDKNPDLIASAQNRTAQLPKERVQFAVRDFDEELPPGFPPFHWAFAIYSFYYTDKPEATITRYKASLVKNGKFVVIGPGSDNAKELESFNFEITGKRPSAKYLGTLERIEVEFLPLFHKIFGTQKVEIQAMDTFMTFPTTHEYLEYYWSTLLWRESTAGRSDDEIAALKKNAEALASSKQLPIKLKKQLRCLVGIA